MKKPEVSLNIEVASVLYQEIQDYLDKNPKWDKNSLITASLDLFLMQNSNHDDSEAVDNHGKFYIQAICENSNDTNIF